MPEKKNEARDAWPAGPIAGSKVGCSVDNNGKSCEYLLNSYKIWRQRGRETGALERNYLYIYDIIYDMYNRCTATTAT